MNWKAIVEAVKKFPFAAKIKPVWKFLLRNLAEISIEEFRRKVVALESQGPAAVDKLIDKWQADLKKKITGSWIPDWAEVKACEIIQENGDELQGKLHTAIEAGGGPLVNKLFGELSADVLARIDAL